MALKRQAFTREFKLRVVTEAESGKPMAQIAREHQVNANTLAKWRKQLRKYSDTAFAGNGNAYTEEARVAELERMVGRLTMECDFLKKALQTLNHVPPSVGATGKSPR